MAIYLLCIGVYLFGTIKTNSEGIPKDGVFKKTGSDKRDRGECQVQSQEISYVDNDQIPRKHTVWFVSWMDNKPVHLLSTFKIFLDTCSRIFKQAKKYAGHVTLYIPSVIKCYNKIMGGTDNFD